MGGSEAYKEEEKTRLWEMVFLLRGYYGRLLWTYRPTFPSAFSTLPVADPRATLKAVHNQPCLLPCLLILLLSPQSP